VEKPTTGMRVLPSPEDICQLLRVKVIAAVQELLEEEISLLLGSNRYERTETRNGYRNGGELRQVTTENGPMELKIPRARVRQADGSTTEFRSSVLPRYQRRTKRVDEAIIGAYLHKLHNLLDHCPKHARAELKRDYNAIVYARNGMAAREAREKFLRKWRSLCAEVARSLEEAGDHLLTFFEFPKAMWKSLRTTNPIENLNREFRRRTKTQGSFSTEDSALTLLWGLTAFGQIRMRKIDGYQHAAMLLATAKPKAAAA
jgi:transposase-like protein